MRVVSLCKKKIEWCHCSSSRFIICCFCSTKPSSPPPPPPSSDPYSAPGAPSTLPLPPPPPPATTHTQLDNNKFDDDDDDSSCGPAQDPIGLSGSGCSEAIGCGEGCPDDDDDDDDDDDKQEEEEEAQKEIGIKSSLRKKRDECDGNVEIKKKNVQWMDFLGKDLVEVNEFESSDAGESDDEGMTNRHCLCNIL